MNARPDDLIHWETIVITPDATGLFEKLKEGGNTVISDGVIVLPSNNDNDRRGFYVRDPDGHVVGYLRSNTYWVTKFDMYAEELFQNGLS